MKRIASVILTLAAVCAAPFVSAQNVAITAQLPSVSATINGQQITIARDQDTAAILTGEFARTSRPCPDFCIQPMIAATGVRTIGELEVLDFITGHVSAGTGLLIDARLPEWFAKGSLPAAVNVPFAALAADNPYQADILRALGANEQDGALVFSNARQLVIYGNGPWDDQGSRAIKQLIAAGYPAEHIQNYRGGLQDWLHLGLTVILPNP